MECTDDNIAFSVEHSRTAGAQLVQRAPRGWRQLCEAAHVHITREGGEVVIVLNAPEQGVSVRDVRGMRPADVRQAVAIVETNADYLRQQWRKYHGE